MDTITVPIEGNFFDKYNCQNWMVKKIMKNFFGKLKTGLNDTQGVKYILDVGCGDGYVTNLIAKNKTNAIIYGIDISANIILKAAQNYPEVKFMVSSVYNMPFKDNSYDLVIACELLEQLEYPQQVVINLLKMSSKYCIFSVPCEPIWRVCNIMRGKYLSRGGNTPGHINHWSRSGFIAFISRFAHICNVLTPFPWTMIVCEKFNE